MQGKLMNLAVLLDHEPPDVQALCTIASAKVTQERLQNELAQMRQVIRPDLAMRLHVARSDKSGENVLLEPSLPAALKDVVTKAVRRAATARRRSPGGTQLDVFAYLIRSWLADKGPILVKDIQKAVGASHPTVAAVLEQLKKQGVLHRLSDRSVELKGFPRDEWPRWFEVAALPPPLLRGPMFDTSLAMASAAAAVESFTLPEVTQTTIFTRVEGRTPMPDGEDLAALAAHRTTLCIFLSITLLHKVEAGLRAAGWSDDAPVLVVHKASWPGEERIVRGTLATIKQQCRDAGIVSQAMVIASPTLGARHWPELTRSRLYDPGFTHRFRKATT